MRGRPDVGTYLKDPSAEIDYSVDWAAGYLDGQTIFLSQWAVAPAEPGGVAVLTEAQSGGRTPATLTGGMPGRVYRVTNRVTLSDGRRDERTLTLRVEQR